MKNNNLNIPIERMSEVVLGSEMYVTCGDEVLMFHRSQKASKFPGALCGPGGHVDYGEDLLTAAIRETSEETGIKVSKESCRLIALAIHYHLDHQQTYVISVFLSQIPKRQAVSPKHIEGYGEWLKIEGVLKRNDIFPPAKYYLDHILKKEKGILLTNIEWEKSKLVRVLNRSISG